MTSHFPNLSSLQIGGGPAAPREPADVAPSTAADGIAQPLPGRFFAELPDARLRDANYTQALTGDDNLELLRTIAMRVENNEVIASFRVAPFYETLAQGVAAGRMQWWLAWQKYAEQIIIGAGSFNQASLVKGSAMPPAAMFAKLFGRPAPSNGMIIRRSLEKTQKKEVVLEMITASYAQAKGIGPTIYAQFYSEKAGDADRMSPPGPWDEEVPATPEPSPVAGRMIAKSKGLMVGLVVTVAEAWEGDCEGIVGVAVGSRSVDPGEFGSKLVDLASRAADAGFWHMDIKRANILHRADADGELELTFTDFDPYFCRIRAPNVREASKRCCTVATIAMVLGELRCQDGKKAWETYAPACVAALGAAGIVLSEIEPREWCFFLRDMDETRTIEDELGKRRKLTKASLGEEELLLGERFRGHIENYFQHESDDTEDGNAEKLARCFEFKRKEPLFPQIVKYAFER